MDIGGEEYRVQIVPNKEVLRSVHKIRFSDPIFSLSLFQLIEMLIRVSNFFEFEYKIGFDKSVRVTQPLRYALRTFRVATEICRPNSSRFLRTSFSILCNVCSVHCRDIMIS